MNNVKGEVKTLCALSAANDALIYVLLEATGLEADATLKDYDDLSALLAGSSNEQTNQARKSVTSATITVDDTNDRVDIDIADQTYAALGGNPVGKLLICWDGDTTTGTDANIRPLTAHSFDITPDSTDVQAIIASSGFYRAS
jgi:hypothetical protein